MNTLNKINNILNEAKESEVEFARRHCGKLTKEQEIMINAAVKKGTFLGVGRGLGRSKYFPLVLIGSTRNVIDERGYYQMASEDGDGLLYKGPNDWNKILNRMR
jgi:hypothetical protein